ncbi:MAG: hypothetical protein KR126chlam3_01464 [Chlamydiae bacterium]|nr:hypothetical protein [Chlamydiota bacterium]
MHFFIRGMIIGFSIAAPVGAIGIHCIRKTIQFGRLTGLASGLGAAAANLIYGIIGVFGLTSISKVLLAEQFWIRLIGGLFLMFLGANSTLQLLATSVMPPEASFSL